MNNLRNNLAQLLPQFIFLINFSPAFVADLVTW